MGSYRITIVGTITERWILDIDADSPEEAELEAWEEVRYEDATEVSIDSMRVESLELLK